MKLFLNMRHYSFCILCIFLFFVKSLKADEIQKDTYVYIMYGANLAINMNVVSNSDNVDIETGEINTFIYEYDLSNDTFYNSNLIFGIRFSNYYSFEIDMNEFEIFFNKKDGVSASNREFREIKYKSSSTFLNIKYDFYKKYNTVFFVTAGVGFMQVNPVEQTADGGLALEPAYLFGAGAYYPIINAIDFEVSLKTTANISHKEQHFTLGYANSTKYQDTRLNFYLKVKRSFL